MVDTRCATISNADSEVCGFSAARSRASVPRSSAENESSNTKISGRTTRARAIESRCRCPPDTFVPPWVISLSIPSGIACTNPEAWAISSACHNSSSVASGRPKRRFDATVPEKRNGFCGT